MCKGQRERVSLTGASYCIGKYRDAMCMAVVKPLPRGRRCGSPVDLGGQAGLTDGQAWPDLDGWVTPAIILSIPLHTGGHHCRRCRIFVPLLSLCSPPRSLLLHRRRASRPGITKHPSFGPLRKRRGVQWDWDRARTRIYESMNLRLAELNLDL